MRGRKQAVPEIAPEQRTVVEELPHQQALHPWVRERLELVKARALGQDLASSATWYGQTVRTAALPGGRVGVARSLDARSAPVAQLPADFAVPIALRCMLARCAPATLAAFSPRLAPCRCAPWWRTPIVRPA